MLGSLGSAVERTIFIVSLIGHGMDSQSEAPKTSVVSSSKNFHNSADSIGLGTPGLQDSEPINLQFLIYIDLLDFSSE